MNDGPWKSAAPPAEIAFDVKWTDALVDDYYAVLEGRYPGTEPAGGRAPSGENAMVVIIALIIAAMIGASALFGAPPIIVWSELAIVAALTCGFVFVLSPFLRRRQQRKLAGKLRAAPVDRITIGPEGIAVESDHEHSRRNWSAVKSFFNARSGLGVKMIDDAIMILAHANLPADISGEELVRRIEHWRKAADRG